MKSALIGSTGFVGGIISTQRQFSDYYHSTNIHDIQNKEYDFVVCAGAPGVKWQANKYPEKDQESIQKLTQNLVTIKAKHFVLISTIDVYPQPNLVNEKIKISERQLQPYGKHRYELEKFVASHFSGHTIVRLPGLFGHGLKKNFIFDLIHRQNLHLTHSESVFQFYDMNNLWKDIEIAVNNFITLINFATEPIEVSDLVSYVFGTTFTNITDSPPVTYDMHTLYGKLYGSQAPYIYSKEYTLKRIKHFIHQTIL